MVRVVEWVVVGDAEWVVMVGVVKSRWWGLLLFGASPTIIPCPCIAQTPTPVSEKT